MRTPTVKPRTHGEQARQRLLDAALRLFANKGFAKTSTREIAQAAGANIAAIRYYFTDKEGLYRAAFTEPMGSAKDDIALFDAASLSLHDALAGLFHGFTEPLKQGELVQLCTRLHMREMVEPTGLWAHELDNGIVPYHAALLKVLQRHLGVKRVDDDLQRLAQAIVSMGVYLYIGRDVMQKLAPQLIAGAAALARTHESLVSYALAMVQAEGQRRNAKKPQLAKAGKSPLRATRTKEPKATNARNSPNTRLKLAA
jgi:TetR/AcrR family transcriptional regulator, regulator of cefoperazone and chloramphenicol sensitivity